MVGHFGIPHQNIGEGIFRNFKAHDIAAVSAFFHVNLQSIINRNIGRDHNLIARHAMTKISLHIGIFAAVNVRYLC
ncbi:hypothetical protein D3C87_1617340 [compost metagenome]